MNLVMIPDQGCPMLTQDVVSANTLPTVCRIYILIIFILFIITIYLSFLYHSSPLSFFFNAHGLYHLHDVYLSENILPSDIWAEDDRTIEFTEVHWIWRAVWCLFGWRLNPLLANLALEGTISSHHRLTLFAPGGSSNYKNSLLLLTAAAALSQNSQIAV